MHIATIRGMRSPLSLSCTWTLPALHSALLMSQGYLFVLVINISYVISLSHASFLFNACPNTDTTSVNDSLATEPPSSGTISLPPSEMQTPYLYSNQDLRHSSLVHPIATSNCVNKPIICWPSQSASITRHNRTQKKKKKKRNTTSKH